MPCEAARKVASSAPHRPAGSTFSVEGLQLLAVYIVLGIAFYLMPAVR